MKKSLSLLAALCFSAGTLAFELEHSHGSIEMPHTPKTIATFDLATLDSLTTLGVEVQGVPKSNYSGILQKYNQATTVGTLFEPDFAELEQLQPDLIFAARRSLPKVGELEQFAPVVVLDADVNDFMRSFNRHNLSLAKAFGKQQQASRQLAQINANIEQLQQHNQGKSGVFLFVINDLIIAHAPGDRFGFAYEITGLDSVLPPADPQTLNAPRPEPGSAEARAAAERRARQLEQIAQADPDWLIVLDRGALNGAEKTAHKTLARHPLLSQTSAYKNGRVYYAEVNPWYVITGGLTNFKQISQDLLEQMR